MTEKLIMLPDKEDILRRLGDPIVDDHLRDFLHGFHERVAQRAGQPLDPGGLVMLLMLSMVDFTDSLGNPPCVLAQLLVTGPRIIRRLVDDVELRAETLACWQEATSAP